MYRRGSSERWQNEEKVREIRDGEKGEESGRRQITIQTLILFRTATRARRAVKTRARASPLRPPQGGRTVPSAHRLQAVDESDNPIGDLDRDAEIPDSNRGRSIHCTLTDVHYFGQPVVVGVKDVAFAVDWFSPRLPVRFPETAFVSRIQLIGCVEHFLLPGISKMKYKNIRTKYIISERVTSGYPWRDSIVGLPCGGPHGSPTGFSHELQFM